MERPEETWVLSFSLYLEVFAKFTRDIMRRNSHIFRGGYIMQNFVGYCMEINPKTRKLEKKWKECVANDRLDAARRMGVSLKTVCLAQ